MQKIVAVRIEDKGETLQVSGYVAREKNRARVWTIDVLKGDKAQTVALVENMERIRAGNVEE